MTLRSTTSVRWAARYAVVDELWRGRARVIVDPVLEAVLRDGGPGVAHGSDPALRELVDDLVPVEPIDGEPVWMAVATADIAAELGPARPGTTFVPLTAIADVLGRAHWDVALVDLSADLDPGMRGGAGERAASALDELGIDGGRGRAVVLSVPVRDYPRSEHGLDYDEMVTLVVEQLGGGRLYGLYAPPMVAVVEFGDVDDEDLDDDARTLQLRDGEEIDDTELGDDAEIDDDAELGDDEEEVEEFEEFEDDDEDVPLTYDNTLGSQEPRLLEYIAIAGAEAPIDGLALVELPAFDEGNDDGGARTQLASARRQADLAAIDRQTQLERAEGLERDNAELRRQVDELRDELAQGTAPIGVATEVALQAALAREQALRWRVSELEDALSQTMSRPVDDLEAELAHLRELIRIDPPRGNGRAGARADPGAGAGADPGADSDPDSDADADSGLRRGRGFGPGPGRGSAPGRATGSGLARPAGPGLGATASSAAPLRLRLEALVRRIERGGIGTLELRRELVDLAKRLHP